MILKAACRNPKFAYRYAYEIDKSIEQLPGKRFVNSGHLYMHYIDRCQEMILGKRLAKIQIDINMRKI